MASTATGLQVVWAHRDEKQIEAELKRLDPSLFLDKERDPKTGRLFYVVRYWLGSGTPPVHVHDWKDERGEPLPLSTGLVYEVESRKRFYGRNIVRDAERANDELTERQSEQFNEQLDEIREDFQRHATLGNFAVVPRSPELRRARSRAREREARERRGEA